MNEIGSLSPKSTIQFTEKGSSRCICVMGAKARGWQGIIFPFEYILRKGRFLGKGVGRNMKARESKKRTNVNHNDYKEEEESLTCRVHKALSVGGEGPVCLATM